MESLLASEICTAMMRIGTRMAAVFDREFRPHGLSQAQFRTLLVVAEEPEGLAPSALADRLLLERATITSVVDRMVVQGLLERRAGSDRRSHRLVLTEAGRERMCAAIPPAVMLADHTLSGMSPKDLKALQETLSQIEARVRAHDRRDER